MTGSVSFRIRRVWFDAIVAGTKTVEVRKHSDYWADVKARGPSVAVFVCGKDVHRRRITAITPYPTAAAALGHATTEATLTGAVLGFHLGEVVEVHETTRGGGRAFRFEVPGEGVPWARPRFVRTAKGMRSFTQSNVANHEQLVRLVFDREVNEQGVLGWFPFEGEVSMWVVFVRAPPKSMSKKRTAEALSGAAHPTTKPDLDNLVKTVKDALNQYAYRDDAQIVSLRASKAYGPVPRTVIVLLEGYAAPEGVP